MEKSPLPMVACTCPVMQMTGGLKLGQPRLICRNRKAMQMFQEVGFFFF